MAKYGMSMCVLGMAEEFRAEGIARQRAVAALGDRDGGHCDDPGRGGRYRRGCASPRSSPMRRTRFSCAMRARPRARFFIDEEVLAETGVTDLARYAMKPGEPLCPTFFCSGSVAARP